MFHKLSIPPSFLRTNDKNACILNSGFHKVVGLIPDCSICVSGVCDPGYGCVDVCPPGKQQQDFCTLGRLNNLNFNTESYVRDVKYMDSKYRFNW